MTTQSAEAPGDVIASTQALRPNTMKLDSRLEIQGMRLEEDAAVGKIQLAAHYLGTLSKVGGALPDHSLVVVQGGFHAAT